MSSSEKHTRRTISHFTAGSKRKAHHVQQTVVGDDNQSVHVLAQRLNAVSGLQHRRALAPSITMNPSKQGGSERASTVWRSVSMQSVACKQIRAGACSTDASDMEACGKGAGTLADTRMQSAELVAALPAPPPEAPHLQRAAPALEREGVGDHAHGQDAHVLFHSRWRRKNREGDEAGRRAVGSVQNPFRECRLAANRVPALL